MEKRGNRVSIEKVKEYFSQWNMISGAVMAPLVGIAGSYTAMPMGLIMAGGEIGAIAAFYLWIYPFHKNIEKTK